MTDVTFDTLPFDIISIIFSYSLFFSDRKESDQKKTFELVSKKMQRAIGNFQNVRVSNLLTYDDMEDACEIFEQNRHASPFGNLSFCDLLKLSFRCAFDIAYFPKWVDFVISENQLTTEFALEVLKKQHTLSIWGRLKSTTLLRLFRETDGQLGFTDFKYGIMTMYDNMSFSSRYRYSSAYEYSYNHGVCQSHLRAIFIAWRKSFKSAYGCFLNIHPTSEIATQFFNIVDDIDMNTDDYYFEINCLQMEVRDAKLCFPQIDFGDLEFVTMPIIVPFHENYQQCITERVICAFSDLHSYQRSLTQYDDIYDENGQDFDDDEYEQYYDSEDDDLDDLDDLDAVDESNAGVLRF